MLTLVYWWLSPARSPAMDTAESRLGRGRDRPTRLRCWSDCCAAEDGASALRAQCPLSMGTSRTSALPLCFEPALPMDGGEPGLLLQDGAACLRSLWRLHRKEPGWFVGEHMQDRRPLLAAAPAGAGEEDETLTDLPGERVAPPAGRLTRVGEAEQ